MTKEEAYEEYCLLRSSGLTKRQMAERLGMKPESFKRALMRYARQYQVAIPPDPDPGFSYINSTFGLCARDRERCPKGHYLKKGRTDCATC